MKKIAFINQKGGVGKTTSVINIGAGLIRLKKKVLVIDFDPQAQLTYSLGIQSHELEQDIYDLLKGKASVEDILIETNKLKVIPATLELSGAEMELSGITGREYLLKEALENITDFDYILIDCPPSLGFLTLNALTTAHEIYIPMQTEFLALQGMSQLLRTIDIVKKRLNNNLEITGIIATRYDKRKNLNKEVIDKINEYFREKLFKTFIRDNIALAEAPSFGLTIFEYKPRSYGAQDYLNLCKEIIRRSYDYGQKIQIRL